MAHFAKLNQENIVTEVIVIPNKVLLDENGEEKEILGIQYCQSLLGEDTKWVQTSYNGNFRFRFAGKGYYYDEEKDIFTNPKPYDSWIYDEKIHDWVPPIPKPNDYYGCQWVWNSEINNWKPIYV